MRAMSTRYRLTIAQSLMSLHLKNGILKITPRQMNVKEAKGLSGRHLDIDYDALHLACAENGDADILLTVDDRFLGVKQKDAAPY